MNTAFHAGQRRGTEMKEDEEHSIRELKQGIEEDAKRLGEIARKLKLATVTKEEERRLTNLQSECRARIAQLQAEIKRLEA